MSNFEWRVQGGKTDPKVLICKGAHADDPDTHDDRFDLQMARDRSRSELWCQSCEEGPMATFIPFQSVDRAQGITPTLSDMLDAGLGQDDDVIDTRCLNVPSHEKGPCDGWTFHVLDYGVDGLWLECRTCRYQVAVLIQPGHQTKSNRGGD